MYKEIKSPAFLAGQFYILALFSKLYSFSTHSLALLQSFVFSSSITFTHADEIGSDLDTFILLNVFHTLFQCHQCFWERCG